MAQDYIIQSLTEAGFAEVVDPLTALAVSQNVAAGGIGGGAEDILALADDARAGTVVSGSYYTAADSVHIQTRISDAIDGRLLGTVGPVSGSLAAQSELVGVLGQQVVAALASLLNQEIGSFEPAVRPAAYESYEAYGEGLDAYLRNDFAEAARHFERAAAVDPTFSRATLWAAQSWAVQSFAMRSWCMELWPVQSFGGSFERRRADSLIALLVESPGRLSRYERCRFDFVTAMWGQDPSASYEAARCMLQAAPGSDDAKREVSNWAGWLNRPGEKMQLLTELDPDRGLMRRWRDYWDYLADAYHMLGAYEGELQVLRESLERGTARILATEARALAALGRLDDVAAILDTMQSLPSGEPLGYYFGYVALELRAHGHPEVASRVFDESIAWYQSWSEDSEEQRAAQAMWLYRAGRWDEARRLYEALADEHPENTMYLAAVGRLSARFGDRVEAMRISATLESGEDPQVEPWHVLERARIAALLGEREQATGLLEQALSQGANLGYGPWLHRDVDFESLRDYPPFQELMRPKG